MRAVLGAEIHCRIEGVSGNASHYWLYDIWIEGAFDPARPTKICLAARECPTFYAGSYGYETGWTGSGVGTQDEFGQINVAAVTGSDGGYGYGYGYSGSAEASAARYLRIRNLSNASYAPLAIEGVLTRIPTQP